MKKILILGILFLYIGNAFGQLERKVPFSIAVAAHIKKYNLKSNEAYKDQDLEYAQFLFDSLVENHLVGTYMDNFKMSPIKGEPISFKEIEKPIFLITYATWCVPGIGEIPALNDLSDKFHDQIDFIVLFWDTKERLKEKEDEYSENIQLLYVNELTNQNSYIIKSLLIADLDAKGELVPKTEEEEKKKKKKLKDQDNRTQEERDIDAEYERYRREKDSLDNQRKGN